jgi:DNA-nicking Smr family endonuclease
VKKKIIVSSKDKEDWIAFTKEMGNVGVKESDFIKVDEKLIKTPKLDLHGFALDQANNVAKKFIIKFFNKGYKKLLIVTGKGLRSKSHKNPYVSEKLSMLKYSIPEYIENDNDLVNKINKVTQANLKDGGDGAIYVFLNN